MFATALTALTLALTLTVLTSGVQGDTEVIAGMTNIHSEVFDIQRYLNWTSDNSAAEGRAIFYARFPKGEHPQKGETLVFTNAISNSGDGYDNNTGILTAPQSGVYVFHATVGTSAKTSLAGPVAEVMVDKMPVGNIYPGDMGEGPYHTGTGHVIVHVQQGQKVTVTVVDEVDTLQGIVNTYSGFLLMGDDIVPLDTSVTAESAGEAFQMGDMSLEDAMNATVTAVLALEQEIDSLLKKIERKANRCHISFYARYPRVEEMKAKGETLVFTEVLNNDGEDYDNTTGFFTAPADGFYVFHATIGSATNAKSRDADAEIIIDGKSRSYIAAAQPEAGGPRRTSSGHVIVKMDAGEKAWVRVAGQEKFYWGKGTTFSGFMLICTGQGTGPTTTPVPPTTTTTPTPSTTTTTPTPSTTTTTPTPSTTMPAPTTTTTEKPEPVCPASCDAPAEEISFHAELEGGATHTVTKGKTVTYNKVISNEGEGYDPLTGIFTAPDDGTYAFHVSAGSGDANTDVSLEIMVNGKYKRCVTTKKGQGVTQLVLELEEGDEVKVRGLCGASITDSTFGGVLVHECTGLSKEQVKKKQVKSRAKKSSKKVNKLMKKLYGLGGGGLGPTVSFHAGLDSGAVDGTIVMEGKTPPMTEVTNNCGNDYNNETSIFTVPFNGTYVFHTKVFTDNWNEGTALKLTVDGEIINEAFAPAVKQGEEWTGSAHAVLQLGYGQNVSLTTATLAGVGRYLSKHTTFTGFLLTADKGALKSLPRRSHRDIIRDMKAKLALMKERIQYLKDNPEIANATTIPRVSFYARLATQGEPAHLASVDLNFADVITNNGPYYDPTTGVFTAPQNGTYVFHATVGSTLQASANAEEEVKVLVDGTPIAYARAGYDFKSHPSERRTGSGHVIVDLAMGARVWVQMDLAKAGHLWALTTTFSGFQISDSCAHGSGELREMYL